MSPCRLHSVGFVVGRLARVGAALVLAACHDWDAYDPRLSEDGLGGVGASGAAGGAGAGPSGGAGGQGGEGTGGLNDGGAGAEGGGGATSMTALYQAAVAECIDPSNPNPDTCATEVGAGLITVDLDQNGLGERHAFLRFDLDDVFVGKTVDEVLLRLRVPTLMGSDSDQTGDVWQVTEFTRADLFGSEPSNVGSSPVAANLGATPQGALVEFTLPSALVAVDESVFLALRPLSANGVDYIDSEGVEPPALVVRYH